MLYVTQGDEAAVRAVPFASRGGVPGPVLRAGLRPLVPQLSLLRTPHHPHPALRSRGQSGRLANGRLTVQSQRYLLFIR